MNKNIDDNLRQADWSKRIWDLPETLEEFSAMHEDDFSLKAHMFKLLYLPVGRYMPDKLKAQLREKFGQDFIPKFTDRKQKDEKKDIHSGSGANTFSTTLHDGMAGRREELRMITRQRRRMRTRRVIKYKLPDKKED